jgi:SAM-dependent methyltransferase
MVLEVILSHQHTKNSTNYGGTMTEQSMQKMQARLKDALQNPAVQTMVTRDLTHVFTKLNLCDKLVRHYVKLIIGGLSNTEELEGTEWGIHAALQGEGIFELLEKGLADRAALVFRQIMLYLPEGRKILDFGCGDGQVTDLVYKNISMATEGYDLVGYRAPGVEAPVHLFNGKMVPRSDCYYDAAIVTNVLHHEEHNEPLLAELYRVIRYGGRLVVLETVPVHNTPEEFERTFVSDYVYNRLFHDVDIPVPGTYETTENWVKRFYDHNFLLEQFDGVPNPFPLGYDQPLIRDWHVRMVFRRMK